MKSEKQIERHINAIERQIERGGDYYDLKAQEDALEWVLGYNDVPRKIKPKEVKTHES
jgi:hypothetical protein